MKMKNFAINMTGMVIYFAFDVTARQEKPLLLGSPNLAELVDQITGKGAGRTVVEQNKHLRTRRRSFGAVRGKFQNGLNLFPRHTIFNIAVVQRGRVVRPERFELPT